MMTSQRRPRVGLLSMLGAWQTVFRDPDFRRLLLLFILFGIANSVSQPYLSIWGSRDLGLGPFEVGLLLTVPAIVSVASNFLVGLYSDRIGRRTPLIVLGLLITALAHAWLLLVDSLPLAIVALSLGSLGFMAPGFALLDDVLRARAADSPTGVVPRGAITGVLRLGISLGWIVGPAVGGVLAQGTDLRALFAATAAICLVGTWYATGLREPPRATSTSGGAAGDTTPPLTRAEKVGLTVFAASMVFGGAAGVLKATFLPVYMTEHLGMPLTAVSLLIVAGVVAELVVIPLAGHLADSVSARLVVAAGIAAGAIYFVPLLFATSLPALLVLELFMVVNIGVLQSVAITYAQDVVPGRGGTSTGAYFASLRLRSLLGSMLAGAAIDQVGLPAGFLVGTAFGLVGLALFLWLSTRRPTPAASSIRPASVVTL